MTDKMSKEARSRTMAAIKGKNTTPERVLQELLLAAGISFETHADDLPARPDIVLREHKVAVLVDGDFWHGWHYCQWRHKLNEYWQKKIDRNVRRDECNRRKLRRMGWTVIRIWEHQVEKDAKACVTRIVSRTGLVVDSVVRPKPK